MNSLFDDLPQTVERSAYGTVPQAAARATDPSTSGAAADDMNACGASEAHVQAVVRLVRMYPGLTAVELRVRLKNLLPIGTWPDMDRWEISRRLPNARDRGLIREGPKRLGLNDKGRETMMLTWEAVP